jgi:hypothetical protein
MTITYILWVEDTLTVVLIFVLYMFSLITAQQQRICHCIIIIIMINGVARKKDTCRLVEHRTAHWYLNLKTHRCMSQSPPPKPTVTFITVFSSYPGNNMIKQQTWQYFCFVPGRSYGYKPQYPHWLFWGVLCSLQSLQDSMSNSATQQRLPSIHFIVIIIKHPTTEGHTFWVIASYPSCYVAYVITVMTHATKQEPITMSYTSTDRAICYVKLELQ